MVVEQSILGVCMYVGDGVKDVRVSSNEKADVVWRRMPPRVLVLLSLWLKSSKLTKKILSYTYIVTFS